ncbi:MAG: FGGY-family carbohydrate kinase [Chloroflexi bacterium]|nr:FGGY-family carbohydrate kinase [Chloroflexota bacterium]
MPSDAILVLDAGTSSLRAVLVTRDGAAGSLAERAWTSFTPDDASPYGREYAPRGVEAALSSLLDEASSHAERVRAIACTGQREGVVFADAALNAVMISPNIDARAAGYGIAADVERGDALYAATGHLPSLMHATAKWAWLRDHRPREAAQVRAIIPLADWIALRVARSDQPLMTSAMAAEVGLLDIAAGVPTAALLEAWGIDSALVAPVVAAGHMLSPVRRGAFADARVIMAGPDTQCALAATGALAPGDAAVIAGWSAPVQLVTQGAMFDVRHRTWTGLHIAPESFILESNAGETGRAWQWICDLLELAPGAAAALAGEAPAGSGDMVSVLGARAMHAAAMNASVGALTVPLPLVMAAPDRPAVLRSVLESIACAIRANSEQLESVSGASIDRLRLGGGMSRSPVFARLLCDILDRAVDVATSPETSALGAAALGAVALGWHDSLDEAVAAMAPAREVLLPVPAVSAAYDDQYARWCAMADGIARLGMEA